MADFEGFRARTQAGDLRKHVNDHLLFSVPVLFQGHEDLYAAFRHELTTALGVSGRAIAIVGSAQLGFSLNPSHLGRPFGADSHLPRFG
jgi:hypothetical protein